MKPVLSAGTPRASGDGVLSTTTATGIDATLVGGEANRSLGSRLGRGFVLVVVLALVVRLLVIVATPHFRPQTDAVDYDRIAAALAQDGTFPPSVLTSAGGPTAFRPPLFPIALAGVDKLGGVGSRSTRWMAGRVLEALLGAVTVALIYLLGLRLWGHSVAVLSAAIAAVYPPLVLVGSSLMSESLYIPLVLAAVLSGLLHRGSEHRWSWAIASGVLIGLAELTRSNGIPLLVPIGFLVWSRPRRLAWESMRSPLIVVACTILTLLPWTVRDANVFHQFVPISTQSGYALAGTYNAYAQRRTDYPTTWIPPVIMVRTLTSQSPRLNEAQVSDGLNTSAIDYITANPASIPKTAYWTALRLLNLTGPRYEKWLAPFEAYPVWLVELSVYAFWLTAALALVGLTTRAARSAPWAFWACPLVIFLSTVFVLGATRYRSPADPFVVLLAALGLLAGRRRVGTWRRRAA